MGAGHKAATTVDETILAILRGRPWPTFAEHIWADRAWSYVEDHQRPDHDFREGPPSSTTMAAAYRRLLQAGLIERAPGNPLAYKATPDGEHLGAIPQRLIVAAIARA